MCFINSFSVCGLSFSFYNSAFHRADFNFKKVQLIRFSLVDHTFDVVSKNPSPNPRSPQFSPVLSFRSFIVLCFKLRPVINLGSIFVKSVRCVSRLLFSFFAYGCLFVPALLFEETIPLLLYQILGDRFVWLYFCALCSLLVVYYFSRITLYWLL